MQAPFSSLPHTNQDSEDVATQGRHLAGESMSSSAYAFEIPKGGLGFPGVFDNI